jgi:hypothetical protein
MQKRAVSARKLPIGKKRVSGIICFTLVCFCSRVAQPLWGQAKPLVIASGIPLSVQLPRHAPMKVGAPLDCRLLYPVYVDNQMAIPAGATLRGTVIQLHADRGRRIHGRLRGDFTPFAIPVVKFAELILPDGAQESIVSDSATDGVAILHLSPPPNQKNGSFLAKQLAQAKQQVKDTIAVVTAPGRVDRLVQFIYSQLPYHPQRIEDGTTWTLALAKPLVLMPRDAVQRREPQAAQVSGAENVEWQLHAYLQQTISSANRKAGDSFRALVTEPIFNADQTLAVPEGSLLIGEVTQSKAARSFGRKGKLRFRFRELRFPTGFTQPVEATLAGIDANKAADLQVDAEGGIQPKSQNRVIVPLALTLLAGRAFDDDGSRVAHSAVAANGFGIVGRVVGIVSSSPGVAAGIGIYGAALSFYDLWLAHGKDVVFPKNTRIEITTKPRRNPLGVSGAPQ